MVIILLSSRVKLLIRLKMNLSQIQLIKRVIQRNVVRPANHHSHSLASGLLCVIHTAT